MESDVLKNKKRFPFSLQDLLFSVLGSLFAFLLVRWFSDAIPGFTIRLAVYLGGALLFSALGFSLSGLTKEVKWAASSWGGRRLVVAILIKMVGQTALLISPLTGEHSVVIIIMAILSDSVFSLSFIAYPRSLAAQIRREDRELRSLPDTLNTLVSGITPESIQLARSARNTGRYNILGLLTDDPNLGGMVIDEFTIYYASNKQEREHLQWRLGGVDCVLYPKTEGSPSPGAQDVPIREIKDPMNPIGRFLKRTFDIGLSGILLVVFSPLMLLCALAIYLEDGAPVIYSQARLGKGGKEFNIHKFRSMGTDAEKEGPSLFSGDDDPRLTRVGKFLRLHHLDELPQLWNVFVGDMSFIGYRPERAFFVDQIMAVNPRYRYLFQIRPGVTSYATLYNGYTDSLEKMLRRLDLDLYYLRNHSVGFDIRILGLTFLSIVGGKKF